MTTKHLATGVLVLASMACVNSAGCTPAAGAADDAGRVCAGLVRNEAAFSLTYNEDPWLPDAETNAFARQFTVQSQDFYNNYPGGYVWGYALGGKTDATAITLGINIYKPWLMVDQRGEVWKINFSSTGSDCKDPSGEFHVVAERVIRDQSGKLRLWAAQDVPLGPDGKVILTPGWTPEFSVTWEDVGCGLLAGADASNRGNRPAHSVGLRFQAGDGSSVHVEVGGRAQINVAGDTYVIAVAGSTTYVNGGCGDAHFIVYRDGFLYAAEARDAGSP